MEKYKEYKTSVIPGMIEIPSHWKEILNGILFKENVRKAREDDIPLSLSQKDGLIPTDLMKESSLKTSSYDNWKRVIKHDLVLNRFKAHLGVLMASNYEGMVSFHYGVYEPQLPLNTKYYELLYHTDIYKGIYAYTSNGMTVGLQNLSNLAFYGIKGLYPPLDEQEKIVSYIESKISKIDKYIAEKEKEVQLLNELKEAEIAKVVTQGLNPDAKMKDSGISWIGMIPEHWDMKRAKFMFNKNKRARRPEDEVITCFRDGQVTLRKNRRLTGFTESEKYDGYQGIRKGDLVIHQMDAFAGSIGVSDSDGMGTSVYHCCTPKGDYNVYYYAYLIRQMAMSGFIQSLYKGIRERSSDFSFPVFGNQYLTIPPRIEQNAIVAYINEKTAKVESLITDLQAEIEHLKEYKQRLIADCVTGQVNVQNI